MGQSGLPARWSRETCLPQPRTSTQLRVLRDSLPKQLRRQSSAPHRAELGFITQQSWGFI